MGHRVTGEGDGVSALVEQQFIYALGQLPTILHNRLSDGSREPLAQALLAALARSGLHLVLDEEAA